MELRALAPRLESLDRQTIFLVHSWPRGSGFEPVFDELGKRLERRYPDLNVVVKHRNERYSEDDPRLWEEMQSGADAFVYAAAASSSTTHYAFKWSAKLERDGLPGAVLFFDTLDSVSRLTIEAEGVPVRHVAVPFPAEQLGERQNARIADAVVAALTSPLSPDEQRTGTRKRAEPERILTTGTLGEIQDYFHTNGLSDGLPVVPPTGDAVRDMLAGTSHPADEVVVERMIPGGLRVTVEKVAINAVMAGCRPEHMPVLLATLEAFASYDYNSVVRSTNSFGFMQVVNGPIRNELGLKDDTDLLSPGRNANMAMGRALRLFITNLGGGVPGENMMAVIGNLATHPFLFAENEEDSPWEPLSVTQGFPPGSNTLTLFSGGWAHAGNYGHVRFGLEHVAADIADFELPNGATIIISPKRADLLAEAGHTKASVVDSLQVQATQELGTLRSSHFYRDTPETEDLPDSDRIPVFAPGSINIVVAGGDASPMMQAWHMYRPVTVSIDEWR